MNNNTIKPFEIREDLEAITLHARYDASDPINDYTFSSGSGWYARQCVRCKAFFNIPDCANCGGTHFGFCKIAGGGDGIYCTSCDLGTGRWKCSSCGCDNPYSKTVHKLVRKGTPLSEALGLDP